MRVENHPFTTVRPGDIARPYLPITIINPHTSKKLSVYALIDTGADECAFPATFAGILGHNLQAGYEKKVGTGNGVTTAYGHTVSLKIFEYVSDDVVIDFMPNLNVPLLGVKSFLSKFVLRVDYPQEKFSLLLPSAK
ncbi:MAG: hypothetical protein QME32_01820 [Endomicrobiia bacterium]|nr:hypothetical protein [Endomicrobiia bacterium]